MLRLPRAGSEHRVCVVGCCLHKGGLLGCFLVCLFGRGGEGYIHVQRRGWGVVGFMMMNISLSVCLSVCSGRIVFASHTFVEFCNTQTAEKKKK